jgi:hypothetical protein
MVPSPEAVAKVIIEAARAATKESCPQDPSGSPQGLPDELRSSCSDIRLWPEADIQHVPSTN